MRRWSDGYRRCPRRRRLLQGPADPHDVADHYDKWAESYDDDLVAWSYQAPEAVARTVVSREPNAGFSAFGWIASHIWVQ